jgi:hypothetical protein
MQTCARMQRARRRGAREGGSRPERPFRCRRREYVCVVCVCVVCVREREWVCACVCRWVRVLKRVTGITLRLLCYTLYFPHEYTRTQQSHTHTHTQPPTSHLPPSAMPVGESRSAHLPGRRLERGTLTVCVYVCVCVCVCVCVYLLL